MESWIIPVSLLFAWLLAVDFITFLKSNKLAKQSRFRESRHMHDVFVFFLIITALAAFVALAVLVPAKLIPWLEANYK